MLLYLQFTRGLVIGANLYLNLINKKDAFFRRLLIMLHGIIFIEFIIVMLLLGDENDLDKFKKYTGFNLIEKLKF